MTDITVYGPHWSAYTRTVRLTLIEKEVAYKLEEVDFLSGTMPVEQVKHHPFGKVPVLQHGEFMLYETAAICRYIDAAFSEPLLQPTSPQLLGRMAQIIGILDSYISNPARDDFISELLVKPLMGLKPNSFQAQQAAIPISKAFEALCDSLVPGRFLVGNSITLADLHAIPIFDYIDNTPGGSTLINRQAKLRDWWSGIKTRPSVVETRPSLSVFERYPN